MGGRELLERFPREEDAGKRLDVYLRETTDLSRSRIANLIRDGYVRIGDSVAGRPAQEVEPGTAISLLIPETEETGLIPQDLPLSILYEDADLAIVVKPCGMVVHPAAGNESGTLVNALLYHLRDLSGIGGVARPGIVHRLDKDTSGVMVIAKNDSAHLSLTDQFRNRTMEKHYTAIVAGGMREESGRIDAPIGRHPRDRKKMAVVESGRPSQTEWVREKAVNGATVLDVHILTGRTHQIRVHMASIGHPVLGDRLYAPNLRMPAAIPRLMLHARSLALNHPRTGERMRFEAPVPDSFHELIRKLS